MHPCTRALTRRLTSTVVLITFLLNSLVYGSGAFELKAAARATLSVWTFTDDPMLNREILAALYLKNRMIWRADENKRYGRILEDNRADSIMLPSGRYLLRNSVAEEAEKEGGDKLPLIRAVTLEDFHLLMQLFERNSGLKYEEVMEETLARKDLVDKYAGISNRSNVADRIGKRYKRSRRIIFNDVIARAFALKTLVDNKVMRNDELSGEESEFLALAAGLSDPAKFPEEFFDIKLRSEIVWKSQRDKLVRFSSTAGMSGARVHPPSSRLRRAGEWTGARVVEDDFMKGEFSELGSWKFPGMGREEAYERMEDYFENEFTYLKHYRKRRNKGFLGEIVIDKILPPFKEAVLNAIIHGGGCDAALYYRYGDDGHLAIKAVVTDMGEGIESPVYKLEESIEVNSILDKANDRILSMDFDMPEKGRGFRHMVAYPAIFILETKGKRWVKKGKKIIESGVSSVKKGTRITMGWVGGHGTVRKKDKVRPTPPGHPAYFFDLIYGDRFDGREKDGITLDEMRPLVTLQNGAMLSPNTCERDLNRLFGAGLIDKRTVDGKKRYYPVLSDGELIKLLKDGLWWLPVECQVSDVAMKAVELVLGYQSRQELVVKDHAVMDKYFPQGKRLRYAPMSFIFWLVKNGKENDPKVAEFLEKLPEEFRPVLSFSNDKKDHVFTAGSGPRLVFGRWTPGETVTYSLMTRKELLEAMPEAAEYLPAGKNIFIKAVPEKSDEVRYYTAGPAKKYLNKRIFSVSRSSGEIDLHEKKCKEEIAAFIKANDFTAKDKCPLEGIFRKTVTTDGEIELGQRDIPVRIVSKYLKKGRVVEVSSVYCILPPYGMESQWLILIRSEDDGGGKILHYRFTSGDSHNEPVYLGPGRYIAGFAAMVRDGGNDKDDNVKPFYGGSFKARTDAEGKVYLGHFVINGGEIEPKLTLSNLGEGHMVEVKTARSADGTWLLEILPGSSRYPERIFYYFTKDGTLNQYSGEIREETAYYVSEYHFLDAGARKNSYLRRLIDGYEHDLVYGKEQLVSVGGEKIYEPVNEWLSNEPGRYRGLAVYRNGIAKGLVNYIPDESSPEITALYAADKDLAGEIYSEAERYLKSHGATDVTDGRGKRAERVLTPKEAAEKKTGKILCDRSAALEFVKEAAAAGKAVELSMGNDKYSRLPADLSEGGAVPAEPILTREELIRLKGYVWHALKATNVKPSGLSIGIIEDSVMISPEAEGRIAIVQTDAKRKTIWFGELFLKDLLKKDNDPETMAVFSNEVRNFTGYGIPGDLTDPKYVALLVRLAKRGEGLTVPLIPSSASSAQDVINNLAYIKARINPEKGFVKGSDNCRMLGRAIEYYRRTTNNIRKPVFELISSCGYKSSAALAEGIKSTDPRIRAASLVTLGCVGAGAPYGEQGSCADIISAYMDDSNDVVRKASYEALRRLGTDKAAVLLMDKAKSKPGEAGVREVLEELSLMGKTELIGEIVEILRARSHGKELGVPDIPSYLSHLVNPVWIGSNIGTEDGRIIAYRFGYIDWFIYKKLKDGCDPEEMAAVKRALSSVIGACTERIFKEVAGSSGHEAMLLDSLVARFWGIANTVLPLMGESRSMVRMRVSGSEASKLDAELLFAAVRMHERNTKDEMLEAKPFSKAREDKIRYKFSYLTLDDFLSGAYLRALKYADGLFTGRKNLKMVFLPYILAEWIMVESEMREEEHNDAKLRLMARWEAAKRIFKWSKGRIFLREPYEKGVTARYSRDGGKRAFFELMDKAARRDKGAVTAFVKEFMSEKYKDLWKYSVIDPYAEDMAAELLRIDEAMPEYRTLSDGAKSALRLYAYTLCLKEASIDKVAVLWEKEVHAIAREEAMYAGVMPSIGIEIQSVNIPREKYFGWKQALESFGIPSEEILNKTSKNVLEAAFKPVYSPKAYCLAISSLQKLGIDENFKMTSALHISVGEDLGEEAKYIALTLRHFIKRNKAGRGYDRTNPDEWYRRYMRLMSKGFIYSNRKNVPVLKGEKAPEVHTEFRVTHLPRTKQWEDDPDPMYETTIAGVMNLSKALMSYKKGEEEGGLTHEETTLAEIWEEYQAEVTTLYEEEKYSSKEFLDADWREATGDIRDINLLKELNIMKLFERTERYLTEHGDVREEFDARARGLFAEYSRRVAEVVGVRHGRERMELGAWSMAHGVESMRQSEKRKAHSEEGEGGVWRKAIGMDSFKELITSWFPERPKITGYDLGASDGKKTADIKIFLDSIFGEVDFKGIEKKEGIVKHANEEHRPVILGDFELEIDKLLQNGKMDLITALYPYPHTIRAYIDAAKKLVSDEGLVFVEFTERETELIIRASSEEVVKGVTGAEVSGILEAKGFSLVRFNKNFPSLGMHGFDGGKQFFVWSPRGMAALRSGDSPEKRSTGEDEKTPDGNIRQGDSSVGEFFERIDMVEKLDIMGEFKDRIKGLIDNVLRDGGLSTDMAERLAALSEKISTGGIKVYGFDGIVKDENDFFLGWHNMDAGKIYIARDLIKYLDGRSPPVGTHDLLSLSLADEYLIHEIICPYIGHYPSIKIQQKICPGHYDEAAKLSGQTDERPYKGRMGDAIKDFINDKRKSEPFAKIFSQKDTREKLCDLIRKGAGYDWEGHKSELPELAGGYLGKTTINGLIGLNPYPHTLYNWNLLGVAEGGWDCYIEKCGTEKGFFRFTVRFEKEDGEKGPLLFRRDFHIGGFLGVARGRRSHKDEPVLDIMTEPGKRALAEIVTKPGDHIWSGDIGKLGDIDGLYLGITTTTGAINIKAGGGYKYQWAVAGENDAGWHVFVDKAWAANGYYNFSVKLKKIDGAGVLLEKESTFQVGRFLKKIPHSNKRALCSGREPETDVLVIDDRLGTRALTYLLRRPVELDWEAEKNELPLVEGLRLGRTTSTGAIVFTPYPGHQFQWYPLGNNNDAVGWEAVIVKGVVVTSSLYELTVKFTKGEREETRIYQIGRVTRELSWTGKGEGEVVEILDISNNLGLRALEELVNNVDTPGKPVINQEMCDLSGYKLGKTSADGAFFFTPESFYPYEWRALGRPEAGWDGKIAASGLIDGHLRLVVEFTREDTNARCYRIFQVGPLLKDLSGRGEGAGTIRKVLRIFDVSTMFSLGRKYELSANDSSLSYWDSRTGRFNDIDPFTKDPSVIAAGNEMMEAFFALLDHMDERDKQIALSISEGCPDYETAETLGSPLSDVERVRSTIERALARFNDNENCETPGIRVSGGSPKRNTPDGPALSLVNGANGWEQYALSDEQHEVLNKTWAGLWGRGYELSEGHFLYKDVREKLFARGIEGKINIHSPPSGLFYDLLYETALRNGVSLPGRENFRLITHPGTYRDAQGDPRSYNLLIPEKDLSLVERLRNKGRNEYNEWLDHEIEHLADRKGKQKGRESGEEFIAGISPVKSFISYFNSINKPSKNPFVRSFTRILRGISRLYKHWKPVLLDIWELARGYAREERDEIIAAENILLGDEFREHELVGVDNVMNFRKMKKIIGTGVLLRDNDVYNPEGDMCNGIYFAERVFKEVSRILSSGWDKAKPIRVFVIGSGVGIDAMAGIYAAKKLGYKIEITATDINKKAIANTRLNIDHFLGGVLDKEDKITVVHQTGVDPFSDFSGQQYDIVCFDAPNIVDMDFNDIPDHDLHMNASELERILAGMKDHMAADGVFIVANLESVREIMPEGVEIQSYGLGRSELEEMILGGDGRRIFIARRSAAAKSRVQEERPATTTSNIIDLNLPAPRGGEVGKATAVFRLIKKIFDYKGFMTGDVKENINIMLTNRCQLDCEHCVAKELMTRYPNLDYDMGRLKAIFDELKGFKSVYLVGGEPMAYRMKKYDTREVNQDFVDIVRYAAGRVGEVRIDTNGIMIPENIDDAKKFFAMFPKNVIWVLSVDELHNKEIQGRYKRKLADIVSVLETCAADKGLKLKTEYNIRTLRRKPEGKGAFAYMSKAEEKEAAAYQEEIDSLVRDFNLKDKFSAMRNVFSVNSLVAQGNARVMKMKDAKPSFLSAEDVIRHSEDPSKYFLFVTTDGKLTTSDHAAFMDTRPDQTVLGDTLTHSLAEIMFRSVLGDKGLSKGHPEYESLIKSIYLEEAGYSRESQSALEEAKRQYSVGHEYPWLFPHIISHGRNGDKISALSLPLRTDNLLETNGQYLDKVLEIIAGSSETITWDVEFPSDAMYIEFFRRGIDPVASGERMADQMVGWIKDDLVPRYPMSSYKIDGFFVSGRTASIKADLMEFGSIGDVWRHEGPFACFSSWINGMPKYLGTEGAKAFYARLGKYLGEMDPGGQKVLTRWDIDGLGKILQEGPPVVKKRNLGKYDPFDLLKAHDLGEINTFLRTLTPDIYMSRPELILGLLEKLSPGAAEKDNRGKTLTDLLAFISFHRSARSREYTGRLVETAEKTNTDKDIWYIARTLMRHGVKFPNYYQRTDSPMVEDPDYFEAMTGLLISGRESVLKAITYSLVFIRGPKFDQDLAVGEGAIGLYKDYLSREILTDDRDRELLESFFHPEQHDFKKWRDMINSRAEMLEKLRLPIAIGLLRKKGPSGSVEIRFGEKIMNIQVQEALKKLESGGFTAHTENGRIVVCDSKAAEGMGHGAWSMRRAAGRRAQSAEREGEEGGGDILPADGKTPGDGPGHHDGAIIPDGHRAIPPDPRGTPGALLEYMHDNSMFHDNPVRSSGLAGKRGGRDGIRTIYRELKFLKELDLVVDGGSKGYYLQEWLGDVDIRSFLEQNPLLDKAPPSSGKIPQELKARIFAGMLLWWAGLPEKKRSDCVFTPRWHHDPEKLGTDRITFTPDVYRLIQPYVYAGSEAGYDPAYWESDEYYDKKYLICTEACIKGALPIEPTRIRGYLPVFSTQNDPDWVKKTMDRAEEEYHDEIFVLDAYRTIRYGYRMLGDIWMYDAIHGLEHVSMETIAKSLVHLNWVVYGFGDKETRPGFKDLDAVFRLYTLVSYMLKGEREIAAGYIRNQSEDVSGIFTTLDDDTIAIVLSGIAVGRFGEKESVLRVKVPDACRELAGMINEDVLAKYEWFTGNRDGTYEILMRKKGTTPQKVLKKIHDLSARGPDSCKFRELAGMASGREGMKQIRLSLHFLREIGLVVKGNKGYYIVDWLKNTDIEAFMKENPHLAEIPPAKGPVFNDLKSRVFAGMLTWWAGLPDMQREACGFQPRWHWDPLMLGRESVTFTPDVYRVLQPYLGPGAVPDEYPLNMLESSANLDRKALICIGAVINYAGIMDTEDIKPFIPKPSVSGSHDWVIETMGKAVEASRDIGTVRKAYKVFACGFRIVRDLRLYEGLHGVEQVSSSPVEKNIICLRWVFDEAVYDGRADIVDDPSDVSIIWNIMALVLDGETDRAREWVLMKKDSVYFSEQKEEGIARELFELATSAQCEKMSAKGITVKEACRIFAGLLGPKFLKKYDGFSIGDSPQWDTPKRGKQGHKPPGHAAAFFEFIYGRRFSGINGGMSLKEIKKFIAWDFREELALRTCREDLNRLYAAGLVGKKGKGDEAVYFPVLSNRELITAIGEGLWEFSPEATTGQVAVKAAGMARDHFERKEILVRHPDVMDEFIPRTHFRFAFTDLVFWIARRDRSKDTKLANYIEGMPDAYRPSLTVRSGKRVQKFDADKRMQFGKWDEGEDVTYSLVTRNELLREYPGAAKYLPAKEKVFIKAAPSESLKTKYYVIDPSRHYLNRHIFDICRLSGEISLWEMECRSRIAKFIKKGKYADRKNSPMKESFKKAVTSSGHLEVGKTGIIEARIFSKYLRAGTVVQVSAEYVEDPPEVGNEGWALVLKFAYRGKSMKLYYAFKKTEGHFTPIDLSPGKYISTFARAVAKLKGVSSIAGEPFPGDSFRQNTAHDRSIHFGFFRAGGKRIEQRIRLRKLAKGHEVTVEKARAADRSWLLAVKTGSPKYPPVMYYRFTAEGTLFRYTGPVNNPNSTNGDAKVLAREKTAPDGSPSGIYRLLFESFEGRFVKPEAILPLTTGRTDGHLSINTVEKDLDILIDCGLVKRSSGGNKVRAIDLSAADRKKAFDILDTLGTKPYREQVDNAKTELEKIVKRELNFPHALGTEGIHTLNVSNRITDGLLRKDRDAAPIFIGDIYDSKAGEDILIKFAAVENLLCRTHPLFSAGYDVVLVEGEKEYPYYLYRDGEDHALSAARVYIGYKKPVIYLTRQLFEKLSINTLFFILEEEGYHAYDEEYGLSGKRGIPQQRFHPEFYDGLLSTVEHELSMEEGDCPEWRKKYLNSLMGDGKRHYLERRYPREEDGSGQRREPEEEERFYHERMVKLLKKDVFRRPDIENMLKAFTKTGLPSELIFNKLRYLDRMLRKSPDEAGWYIGYHTRMWRRLNHWREREKILKCRRAFEVDVSRGIVAEEEIREKRFVYTNQPLCRVEVGEKDHIPLYIANNHIYLYPVTEILGLEKYAVLNKDFHDDTAGTAVSGYDPAAAGLQEVWDYTVNDMHEGGVFTVLAQTGRLEHLYWIPTELFRHFCYYERSAPLLGIQDIGLCGYHKGPTGHGVGIPIDSPKRRCWGVSPLKDRSGISDKKGKILFDIIPQGGLESAGYEKGVTDYILSIDLDALNSIPAYRFRDEIDNFVSELKSFPYSFKAVFITPSYDYMVYHESQKYWRELLNYTVRRLHEEGILNKDNGHFREGKEIKTRPAKGLSTLQGFTGDDIAGMDIAARILDEGGKGDYDIVGYDEAVTYNRLKAILGTGVLFWKKSVYSPLADTELSIGFAERVNKYTAEILEKRKDKTGPLKVFVIGTGSGIDTMAAIYAAKMKGFNVEITAVDTDIGAVENTLFNIDHFWKDMLTDRDKVEVRRISGLDPFEGLEEGDKYDMILFNAPDTVDDSYEDIDQHDIKISDEEMEGILAGAGKHLAQEGTALIETTFNAHDLFPRDLVLQYSPLPELYAPPYFMPKKRVLFTVNRQPTLLRQACLPSSQGFGGQATDNGPAISLVLTNEGWQSYELTAPQHYVLNKTWAELWRKGYDLPEGHFLYKDVMDKLARRGIEGTIHIHSPPDGMFYGLLYEIAARENVVLPAREGFRIITHPGTYRDGKGDPRSYNLLVPHEELVLIERLKKQWLKGYNEWLSHEIAHIAARKGKKKGDEPGERFITSISPVKLFIRAYNAFNGIKARGEKRIKDRARFSWFLFKEKVKDGIQYLLGRYLGYTREELEEIDELEGVLRDERYLGYGLLGFNDARVYRRLKEVVGTGVIFLAPGVYDPASENALGISFADRVRSETEQLLRGGFDRSRPLRVFVIGSGTGIDAMAAIYAAKGLGYDVHLTAVDIDPAAVGNTRLNIDLFTRGILGVKDRIDVRHEPGLDPFVRSAGEIYDLILFDSPNCVNRPFADIADHSFHINSDEFKEIMKGIEGHLSPDGKAVIANLRLAGSLFPKGLYAEFHTMPEIYPEGGAQLDSRVIFTARHRLRPREIRGTPDELAGHGARRMEHGLGEIENRGSMIGDSPQRDTLEHKKPENTTLYSQIDLAFMTMDKAVRAKENGFAVALSGLWNSGASRELEKKKVTKLKLCVPMGVFRNTADAITAFKKIGNLMKNGIEFELVLTCVEEKDEAIAEAIRDDEKTRRAMGMPEKLAVDIKTTKEMTEDADPRVKYDLATPAGKMQLVKDMYAGVLGDNEYAVIVSDAVDKDKAGALVDKFSKDGDAERKFSFRVVEKPEAGKDEMVSLAAILDDWVIALKSGNGATVASIAPVPVVLVGEIVAVMENAWGVLAAA